MANVEPLFGLNADSSGSERAAEQGEPEAPRRKQLARRQADTSPSNHSPAKVPVPAESQPAARRRIEQRLTVVNPTHLPAGKNPPAPPKFVLPPLPSGEAQRNYSSLIGFALCVLLPVLIASIYYSFIASNQYVAEFRFTVKEAASPALPEAPAGLHALLGMGGNNAFDNYLVTDFLSSRQAVEDLQKRINVVDLYARPGVDWVSRYDASRPIESFVRYWQSRVTAKYDQVTGIATAQVSAFSPQDALLIARTLVSMSEDLVNNMARRSEHDTVRFAQNEVTKAEDRLKAVRAKLTDYRNRFGIIDPGNSVVASNSTLSQSLRANLAQLETQLATLQRQKLQPGAPAIVTLENQIKSTQAQLQAVEATVGTGATGTALSKVVGEYEQLDLERQFAQNMVTGTMQALEQARANATAQHLYITPYVRPSLPQSASYPRPLFDVLKVGALAFAFWLIGLLILRSIRERFA